jgi:hypothetical protein
LVLATYLINESDGRYVHKIIKMPSKNHETIPLNFIIWTVPINNAVSIPVLDCAGTAPRSDNSESDAAVGSVRHTSGVVTAANISDMASEMTAYNRSF